MTDKWILFTSVIIVLLMPTFTNSFNIDTDHPILLQGSQNAQLINKIFGYSLEVTNHVSSQAVLN